MITEALQSDDEQACALAAEQAKEPREQIRNYIAAHAPKSEVDRIVDYLLLNLRGLSAYARLGYTQKKLIDCARTAGRALEEEFGKDAALRRVEDGC
jgi:TetR/AcrR family transcriptional repressor for divergent bdcA